MTEFSSRVVLALEAVVIGLPLTVLFVVFVLPSVLYFQTSQFDLVLVLSSVATLVTLCCAWWLMATFIFRGQVALRATSRAWWLLPFLVAVLGLLAAMRLAFAPVIEPSGINTFIWGVPFILPLLHLSVERWGRLRSNNSFKPKPLRGAA